jgi:hypothetical protein
MSSNAYERKQQQRRPRRAESTTMVAPDTGDPAIGAALLEQLAASIDDDGPMTHQHREIAAGLRRHLAGRARAVDDDVDALQPRYGRRLEAVRAAMHAAASRGAAIEDAIAHALVTGGLLGDLERVIMKRMLTTIGSDVEAASRELDEVTMDAAWIDHGGPG